MIELALTLIIIGGCLALLSVIPALGIGSRLIPGYAFHAKGNEARSYEKALLTRISLIIMSVAIFVSAFGVASFFVDWRVFTALGACLLLVGGGWTYYICRGGLKRLAQKAKQLSE